MRRRRERYNGNSVIGTIVKGLLAILLIIFIGVTAHVVITVGDRLRSSNKIETETIDDVAVNILENGFISSYVETSHKNQKEGFIVKSYIVLYEGDIYLIEIDSRDDKVITFQNVHEGEAI